MAKPNYSFEKKQRELAKKKKQDEKAAKKQSSKEPAHGSADESACAPTPASPDPNAPTAA